MANYWLTSGLLALLLSGCSPEQPQQTESVSSKGLAAAEEKTSSYGPESWKDIIPASCSHFFDGCNTCTRAPDAEVAACTRKACMAYKKPRCLDNETAAAEYQQTDYQCQGGESFKVFRGEYRAGDMRVKLEEDEIWLSDTQTRTAHRMQKVPSASGEKYSDGSITFWAKGAEAIVQQDDKVLYKACTPSAN
ncbi:MliC family protein [Gilvimarinus chinensis]|uniref:MliC family protein n=1 Tax=Gilvimarinus chinensis TaxID=396005 RepID=UPI00036653B3|nr:MliC family protein [Gilvimarinus chinensis]